MVSKANNDLHFPWYEIWKVVTFRVSKAKKCSLSVSCNIENVNFACYMYRAIGALIQVVPPRDDK